MIKIRARIIPALLTVCCALALAGPAAAASKRPQAGAVHNTPPAAGYMWSFNNPIYNYDGADPTINISNPLTGVYVVTFSGLGLIKGGMAQVTPYDSLDTCVLLRWMPSGSDLQVTVACYTLSGIFANALFDLIVTQPFTTPPGTFDYSRVYKYVRSGTLTGRYQFNSAHKSNSVKHLSTGRYQVTFGGPRSSGTHGTVKVSAIGVSAGDCSASGWHGTSQGQVINVNCYTTSGTPVNRQFEVTYANGTNLMGLNHVGLQRFPTANALISSTGRVLTQYENVPHANFTVSHFSAGRYKVQMNGINQNVSFGDVQVSPITGSKAHCIVVSWVGGPKVVTASVACFDSHGHPANSAFAFQFVEGTLIA